MKDWDRVIKRVIFFFAIVFILFSIWKLSVCEATTPIEQRSEDGWFIGMDSQVRSIRLFVETQYRSTVVECSNFTVWITDGNGKKIWEETYGGMSLEDGDFLILEEFEKGEGIGTGTGGYQIYDTIPRDESARIYYKIYFYTGGYGRFYLACSILALVFLAVILCLAMKRGSLYQLSSCYFTVLVLMGVLFSVIMPPLTVPDEESHFRKAYEISSGMLQEEKGLMRKTDNDSITYLHNAASVLRWHKDFHKSADVDEMVNAKWTTVPDTTPAYAYFFPALGILAARLGGLNGHWAILLGRICNLIGVAAIMAVALFLVPFGKKFFCLLGLLPEVVYVVASYSYDGINLALCFLAISYFFYMLSDGKKVRLANIVIFIGIVLIMIPIKLVYAPLLGLLLLIPPRQLEVNKKIIAIAAALGVLGILALLFLRWQDIVVLFQGLAYNTEEGTQVSLKFMLENPGNVIFVFMNNIMSNFDYYINSTLGEFVGRERYGLLLDISHLPQWVVMAIGIFLMAGIYTDVEITLNAWKKAWLVFLGLSSCMLIFLSIYLANNMIDDITIHGMQGRYFLPVLLLLPAFLGRRKNGKGMENEGLSRNAYIILGAGINIIAVFVQLQHMAIDYYG